VPNFRNLARGKPCDLRIPGVCNRNPETTVLAHVNTEFKGIALKSPDTMAIRACFDCHSYFDRLAPSSPEYHELAIYGLARTHKAYIEEGVINIEG